MKTREELRKFYKELYPHNHVPFSIERTMDGRLLLMNNDFKTYSFQDFTRKYIELSNGMYSYRRLFDDDRVKPGDFRVIGWAPIDNLFNHPEQYFTNELQIICNYRTQIRK